MDHNADGRDAAYVVYDAPIMRVVACQYFKDNAMPTEQSRVVHPMK